MTTVPAAAARLAAFRWRWSPLTRARVLGTTAAIVITVVAIVMLPVGFATAFRARRLYAVAVRYTALFVLRLYGIRIRVHRSAPFRRSQAVYISNHTSTIDLFVLVALGLPNCRFFLSGFLRKLVPLGVLAWMMGTFFTVPQDQPDERRRIFQRAARTLGRTQESVYLSPEGGRITTGHIGHFNKGAFHLATTLRAPIVPMFFRIPSDADPGRGYDARPGVVDVHVLDPIDTRAWKVEDVAVNAERVRALFVETHRVYSGQTIHAA